MQPRLIIYKLRIMRVAEFDGSSIGLDDQILKSSRVAAVLTTLTHNIITYIYIMTENIGLRCIQLVIRLCH